VTVDSVDSKVRSWFSKNPAPPAQAGVIRRVCARAAPERNVIHVAELPLGGVQVWVEDTPDRWSVQHRMARELRLAGWHTEASADRLLVLGWSADCLHHRARMLASALKGRLADFDQTAVMAVMIANPLKDRDLSIDEIVLEVEEQLSRSLRWPDRLADLDGLERTATVESLRLRLAQIAGLEAKVARRCAEHLSLATQVALTLAGGEVPTRIRENGRDVGLSERVVAASVPNNSPATVPAEPAPAPVEPELSYAESAR
jgi:hypothetical protein